MKMSDELAGRILRSTIEGGKLHAILRAAFGMNSNKHFPRFGEKAIATSDGFVMCDFIDSEGHGHYGAFVDAWDSIADNVNRLIKHMGLGDDESLALADCLLNWVDITPMLRNAHPATRTAVATRLAARAK